LVALLGLNPIMGLDVIFGQNDVFVLSWIVLALVCWQWWAAGLAQKLAVGAVEGASSSDTFSTSSRGSDTESEGGSLDGSRTRSRKSGGGRRWGLVAASVLFGLACASKPTAWFFAPFFGLLLLSDFPLAALGWRERWGLLPLLVRRAGPALLVFAVLVGPYLVWNPYAMYDDIWRWSSGQGDTGYQIWGWGASNFVLALGWVGDRFGQWPFWAAELLIAGPLALWLLWRQLRCNTLSNACWHYAVLLLGFFYVSRFLNENYLGFLLAFLAIGLLSVRPHGGCGPDAADVRGQTVEGAGKDIRAF
jgi:hypothetical protein